MRRLTVLVLAVAALAAACSKPADEAASQSEAARALPAMSVAQAIIASPSETVAQAASLVQQQPGYNFSFQFSMSGIPDMPAGATGLSVSGTGAVDIQARRTGLSLDLRSVRDLVLASGDPSLSEIDEILGNGVIEVVQDGRTFYLKLPYAAQQLGGTTDWVGLEIPQEHLDGTGSPFEGMGGFGAAGALGTSPGEYLEKLQSIDNTVQQVGTEAVRGVQTTHYRGMLDLRRLLEESLPPEQRGELETMPAMAAFNLPYDVWIDADGLPRRVSINLDLSSLMPAFAPASPTATPVAAPRLNFLYELFDYGSPTSITVPPATAVTFVDPAMFEGASYE